MRKFALVTVVAALALAGCAQDIPTNSTYQYGQTGVAQSVEFATVESVRPVVLDKGTTGVGAGAGALVGGVAGAALIGHGWGSAAAGLLGAVGGGLAGNAIEQNTSKSQGLEITVRRRNGTLLAISQPANEQFYPGDRVRLLNDGGRMRVTH